uniref:Ribosomal protein L1 n=1 Tax=Eucampia antarctica TaxID=49252 RepID=A0A7S2WN01_9STRA|mmetsp:Transcript_6910/g.6544  ORF Transcript_6910/g.6544 Transcript_6910/m.6544 type:complete len:478 (+) Transcript_6910:94-1527(+)|eukprot:CAMPEP_0197826150 /NCGR_PEP_ID=MMETSP1437-20131217/3143_1 /TAXON_ID=49252 ORGANISM="Eucampia antarctica, Strain CCMP1452" /NCGR_SAMPLE_ID=MMETSP1437 /ASSEMBLY_ACC=CAM_ASM_001096 /LENGTH=477 /DNA_ID=CAMNT_0043426461 /DNA_START=81 /DNA_END=1514 /DNA_ORIENTATION=+
MPAKTATPVSSVPTGAGVDSALLEKAMAALLKHHEDTVSKNKSKKSLLPKGDDIPVQVQLTLSRVPTNPSPKPIRIDIPHPFHKPPSHMEVDETDEYLEEAEICLIVKDEDKEWIKDLVKKVGPESSLSCIKKVLGLDSLRKKHSQFSDKRALLQKFDFFLADDRILPMLSKNLGKSFFRAKKQPIPINVTRKSGLPFAVDKCLKATWMFVSAGTCITIKAGDTGMAVEKLHKNVETIISQAVMKIPKKWANVQAICIKSSQSVALPIYNKTKEDLDEIAKLAGIEEESKKRSRELDETSKETMLEEKKKKQKHEVETKSPLLKALKQNRSQVESTKKKIRSPSLGEENEKKSPKLKKKQDGIKENRKEKVKTPKKKQEESMSSKKSKKSKDKENEPEKQSLPKKKEEEKKFIESKKFKGTKKGYSFHKGEQGVGYYVDVLPVLDKMALAAFSRLGKGGGKGRKSPKSTPKKRRGRR